MKTEGSAALVTGPNRGIGTAFSRALIAAAAATAADVTIVINNAGVRAGPVGQLLGRRAAGNGRGRSPRAALSGPLEFLCRPRERATGARDRPRPIQRWAEQ